MPYLEDRTANQDTQSEWQEKRCQDYKDDLRRIWDTIKALQIHLIGVSKENQDVEQLFEEIVMENFANLVKEIDIKPREVQSILKIKDPKRPIPRQDTS